MAVRAGRWWRVAGVMACVVAAAVGPASAPIGTTGTTVRLLQANLCSSGLAPCYTGRSVPATAAVIDRLAPHVVTLNEVCRPDVAALAGALRAVRPGGGDVVDAFTPAPDRRTADATRCRNGEPYGIGLLVRLPRPGHDHTWTSGVYPVQDLADPEERAWLCVHATRHFNACTTHLASTSTAVALAQCRHLFGTAIAGSYAGGRYAPTVVAGDLNLVAGGAPDVRTCLPLDHRHGSDGGVQHVVATADLELVSARSVDMRGATDHPSLLAELRVRPDRRRTRNGAARQPPVG
jgi:endonuclease/exonuclease/phosphatase family metal-dependent hydrolase